MGIERCATNSVGTSSPCRPRLVSGPRRKAGEKLRQQGPQGRLEPLPEATSVSVWPGGVCLCVGDLQGRSYPTPT